MRHIDPDFLQTRAAIRCRASHSGSEHCACPEIRGWRVMREGVRDPIHGTQVSPLVCCRGMRFDGMHLMRTGSTADEAPPGRIEHGECGSSVAAATGPHEARRTGGRRHQGGGAGALASALVRCMISPAPGSVTHRRGALVAKCHGGDEGRRPLLVHTRDGLQSQPGPQAPNCFIAASPASDNLSTPLASPSILMGPFARL